MPSRPSTLPTWATDVGAVIADPGSTKQATGWVSPEKPSDGNFNWWMNLVGQWITNFVQGDGSTPVNRTTGTTYTATAGDFVTLGGTSATAPFTLTLPTGVEGDVVKFKDVNGNLSQYPLTIGGTIEGQTNLLVTRDRMEITCYRTATQWVVI